MRRRVFLLGCAASAAWLGIGGSGRRPAMASTGDAIPRVSVRLFSGYTLAGVEVRADQPMRVVAGDKTFDANVLTADAASAAFDVGGVQIVGATAVAIDSAAPLAVTAYGPANAIMRRYSGSLALDFAGGRLNVINVVDLESYVASTLASEVSPRWHPEALKAQAIAARTYALRKMRSTSARLTDDTSNQVYRGLEGLVPAFADATAATRGLALYYADAPAEIFYSSTCGGHTADSAELSGRPGPPYLGGIADLDADGRAYCMRAPYFVWKNLISAADLARAVGSSEQAQDAVVTARWADGRVKTLQLRYAGGTSAQVDGHEFYRRCAAVLGYKVVPSTMFSIARSADFFALDGHGLGHGVGMCQWGAQGRALAGMAAPAILAAYFPQTTIQNS